MLLQAIQGVADAAAGAVEPAATEAAKAAAANNGGWLAAPIGAIEKAIVFIHEVRAYTRVWMWWESVGVDGWMDWVDGEGSLINSTPVHLSIMYRTPMT